jgi:hypothetical protein
MCNTTVGAVGAGAGAASRYGSGSGSDQKMGLLAAPAPQHCIKPLVKKNPTHNVGFLALKKVSLLYC